MDKEQLEHLIGALAFARLRPGMFLSDDSPAVLTFIAGFQFACGFLGVELNPEYIQLWEARGWGRSSASPISEMQRAGIAPDDIALEAFEILILTLQRKYDISPDALLEKHREMRERSQSKIASSKSIDDRDRERIEHMLHAIEKLEREMGISSSND